MHINPKNKRECVLKVRCTEATLIALKRKATKEGKQTATWAHDELYQLLIQDEQMINQKSQLKRVG